MEKQKMNKLKKVLASMLCFGILCLSVVVLNATTASAAEQTVTLNNGDRLTVQVHPGDTGMIVPNADSIDASDDDWYDDDWYDDDWYDDDWYDSWNDNPVNSTTNGTDSQEVEFEYSVDEYVEQQCVTVDASGKYQVLENFGSQDVTVIGRNSQGRTVFRAAVCFEVRADMTDVTLDQTKVNGYLIPSYDSGDYAAYENAEIDIKVNSPVVLNEDMYGINLGCNTSSNNVWVYASLSDNVLHLSVYGQKKCTVKATVSIAGKEFNITISLKPVKISANSVLLVKGKTKKLKVSSWPGAVEWSSSNKNIASVSKDGTVKGKKIGNVVITAKIDGKRVGCALSVTTAKIKKVCKRAAYIGTNWEYSQEKRTQSGYYDCSALVWKAYKECAGLDFGDSSYPGTTVTESAWCRDHKRIIKGGYTAKKVNKMQINPGDIIFKSEDLKNPYGTTYHVEMFTGYACLGYDSAGKPIVTPLWAARKSGYAVEDGSLLGRPLK